MVRPMGLGERSDLTSMNKVTIKMVTCMATHTSKTRKAHMKAISKMECLVVKGVSRRRGTSEMVSSSMENKKGMVLIQNLGILSIGECLSLAYFMEKEQSKVSRAMKMDTRENSSKGRSMASENLFRIP